ncbi:MAG: hypothetical protein ACHQF4_02350 [Sphingobacteriales bacterium]|jgi:hypothetical protein
MNKKPNKQGRPGKIESQFPLVHMTSRISIEAIEILNDQDNKALYIDSAIKEKNIKNNS